MVDSCDTILMDKYISYYFDNDNNILYKNCLLFNTKIDNASSLQFTIPEIATNDKFFQRFN
jgi:hypothetical protein